MISAVHASGLPLRLLEVASAARGDCLLSGRLLSVGAFAAAAVLALALLALHVRGTTPCQAARSVYLLVNVVVVLNYTFVILDSYDLCATLGVSPGASGRLVGYYMLGFCPGVLAVWYVARRVPDLWKLAPRRVLSAGLTCQLLGTLLYAGIAFEGQDWASGADFATVRAPRLADWLMASRFVAGMGSGICQQYFVPAMLHLTPVAERPEHTTRLIFFSMLSIGAGPMLAASLGTVRGCHDEAPARDFVRVGLCSVVAALCAFSAVLVCHPDIGAAEDQMEKLEVDDEEDTESPAGSASPTPRSPSVASPKSQQSAPRRIAVVCGCLAMANMRAFGISALEVASASLLETEYHWRRTTVGVVVGGIFLCCLPVRLLHLTLGSRLSVVGWIRGMGSAALLGCSLLFGGACAVVGKALAADCAAMLVLAGVVLFPTLFMGEALACGIMHQHVMPEGSWFDGNHTMLWYNLVLGLGRFVGPWAARWSTSEYGQDAFAAQQLVVTCVFLLVFECFVRPNLLNFFEEKDSCDA